MTQQVVEAELGGCDVKAQDTGAPCIRLSPVQRGGGCLVIFPTPCPVQLSSSRVGALGR